MDSKRKANGTATPDSDDRVAKRRKLAESFDLSKGESRESTTAYGLSLVDQIRRTADKSGRRVAGYFETLPPREGNDEYYRRTRMPISLETIEEKLQNGDFQNLSELESYFKRMISNAKEWFPRSSPTFDDAERVRKAVSNYMTKTNPAYQTRGYQAVPTPLPPEDPSQAAAQNEGADEDAEGEEEDIAGGEEGEPDANEPDTASRKRSIILKRRVPSRSARNSMSTPQDTPRKAAISTKPDHQYEDVPYKGLTFQQAQEKVVEEMLRHKEPDYEFAYFEPFVNLPPRALKDYYKMIQEPLSLKKLQKAVKGIHGRNDATGVSEFKTWAQFEEKTRLLWENAYYYNEEGSDIYELAQELEKFFYEEFKRAQVVPEPAQPKIKLKIGQPAEQATPAKKITIHVGNSRGGSVDSPAPQTSQSVGSPAPPVRDVNGGAGHTQLALAPIEKARSVSASVVASPSPSIQPGFKAEDVRMSPAVRPPSAASGQMHAGITRPPYPAVHAQQQFQPVPAAPLEQKRRRRPGIKDALMSRMQLRFHKHGQAEPYIATVLPDAKDMQQSATITLPPDYNHVTMITTLPDFLQDRQYSLWALCERHPLKPNPQLIPNQQPRDRVFEAMLRPGLNMLEAHLIAAIPRSERVLGEDEAELEIFTVFVNVLRN